MNLGGERASARWLTLTRAFLLLTAGTLAAVGLLLFAFLEASRRSTLETAQSLRRDAALRVESAVARDLGAAVETANDLEAQVRLGALDPADRAAVERALVAELIDRPTLSDVALTRATSLGYDADGYVRVGPDPGWELAAYRIAADPASLRLREVARRGDGWAATVREPGSGEGAPAPVVRDGADPTAAATFVEAAARDQGGRPLWSDLHWSELDPGPSRRVVITVQQAVPDAAGRFAGVLRVGLLTERVDEIARMRVDEPGADDPHRVFLCDAQGRLLSRLGPHDRMVLSGDDLRVDGADAPPQVKAALVHPALAKAVASDRAADGDLVLGGRRYLVTFRALADTQGWVVGIVVPEDHYTARLQALRDRFLALYLAVAALALGGGLATARAVRRGLRRVDESIERMRSLDFAPRPTGAPFRDVEAVLDSLERAKTAMRALGKYAPLDLVRELVHANREPRLGGAPADVTVMFSDIRGFTGLAERASPDELAELLGAYLEAMTAAIAGTGGTIDKFIGDAVMALWNVPSPIEGHARRACQAVLECRRATAALYASARWRGMPPLVTRFGLHTARVLAGHFGAPERMSYTVLGDGVNLASRLEALGKQYGVTALVSEAIVRDAGSGFAFRRIDRVAVKGKSIGVTVHELLGPAGEAASPAVAAYEAALEDYFARGFDAAIERLVPNAAADAPSRVLLERCRALRDDPPPADWDGVYVATSK